MFALHYIELINSTPSLRMDHYCNPCGSLLVILFLLLLNLAVVLCMLESITVSLIRLISCSCSQWLRGFLLRNDFNMTPFCLLFIPVIKKKKKTPGDFSSAEIIATAYGCCHLMHRYHIQ